MTLIELKNNITIKPYFEINNIILYNVDCEEILKQIKDKVIDIILTDPPYGIHSGLKTGFIKSRYDKRGTGKNINDELVELNKWDQLPDKNIFKEIFRISKNQILWGFQYYLEYLKNSKEIWIWNKKTGKSFFADAELAWTSYSGTTRIFDYQWCGCFKPDRNEDSLHPCLPKGQKVFFNNKWINIENIKIGDKNKFGEVINVSKHNAKEFIEITVNKNKTIATWNHPFLIKRKNFIYWVNAKDIKQDDFILTLFSLYSTAKPKSEVKKCIKQKKDIFENGQKIKRGSCDLSTMLFGKNIMAKFLLVCKFIIKILTKQIISFPIYNLSRPLNIKGYTLVANLSMENGLSLVKYVGNIKNAIKKIGIILMGGLMGNYVKNAILKDHLIQEKFLLQRVGNVKTIIKKQNVYNVTMSNIPVFETSIGISHNTMKPLELFKWCLRKAKKDDIILDCFSGSGTTSDAIMEINKKDDLNLSSILIEKEKKYCDITIERLKQKQAELKNAFYIGENNLFKNVDKVN